MNSSAPSPLPTTTGDDPQPPRRINRRMSVDIQQGDPSGNAIRQLQQRYEQLEHQHQGIQQLFGY